MHRVTHRVTRRGTVVRASCAAAALALFGAVPAIASAQADDAWSAVLRADARAVLSAPADGLVEVVAVREGERVAAGDALVRFDCTLADAALARAEARLAFARVDQASNEQLAALDSVSDLQLAASTLQLAEGGSDVAVAAHAVRDCTVSAPFDGVVTSRSVQPHESVAAGVELIELVDDASLVVEFLAPSRDVARLVPGTAFGFEIGESRTRRTGTITAVVPEIDPVSRTLTVIGRLDSPPPIAGDVRRGPPLGAAGPAPHALVSGMSGWVALR